MFSFFSPQFRLSDFPKFFLALASFIYCRVRNHKAMQCLMMGFVFVLVLCVVLFVVGFGGVFLVGCFVAVFQDVMSMVNKRFFCAFYKGFLCVASSLLDPLHLKSWCCFWISCAQAECLMRSKGTQYLFCGNCGIRRPAVSTSNIKHRCLTGSCQDQLCSPLCFIAFSYL